MTNNLQNPDLQANNTTGKGVLPEAAEKYIRDTANIEDLPGDDDDDLDDEDLDEDDDDDDIDTVDYEDDVEDVDMDQGDNDAAIDGEEDEDYINKDEAKRDLEERGLRS